jgi:hypothetical protein
MTLRKILFFTFLITLVLCLGAGFAVTGQWLGVGAVVFAGFAWVYARKVPDTWLPFICLFGSVCLAVIGILSASASLLMIVSSGLSLLVWDLLHLDAALGNDPSGEQTSRFEIRHFQSLALALGSGLILVFLGRLIHLQTPFILLMLFVALTVFGLDGAWQNIKRTGDG